MARELGTLVMTLALGACTLNSAGGGSASGAMVLEDDDGTEEGSGAATGDTTGGGSTATSATTAPPGDETADGPTMDDGPAGGHPELTISHAPSFDFAPTNLTQTTKESFIVANEGDGDATAVQVAVVAGAFSIETHDCAETLAPGDTCEVRVVFAPELFGDDQGELQITFQDQGTPTMASVQLTGRGVGTTRNLLINGGGELGNATDIPPMGWTIAIGPTWSANWFEVLPVEGSRTISAGWGPPELTNFTLDQQVDVASYTTWGDAAGLQIHYRVHHRSETNGNDPTWVELRFLDSGGNEIGLHPSSLFSGTTWNVSEGSHLAPPGTHRIRLSLQCDRVYNTWCSGFFDGMEVWGEWQG